MPEWKSRSGLVRSHRSVGKHREPRERVKAREISQSYAYSSDTWNLSEIPENGRDLARSPEGEIRLVSASFGTFRVYKALIV